MLLLWSFIVCQDGNAQDREIRLLFVGDILLSRNVAVEMERRETSPWTHLTPLFGQADFVAGNLEGAVGTPGDCLPTQTNSPCFSISENYIQFLAAAGFKALSVENNHSNDLGEHGRSATTRALEIHGLVPLDYESSPRFFRFNDVIVSMLAINFIPGRDGYHPEIPFVGLRQKLRLARNLSNLVVVSVHWGSELLEWPNAKQRRTAEWLIRHGADLLIGHHPHVVQPPEMISGKPVFFSLGNHLFDQKYPATKEGFIADCRITGGTLRCEGTVTHTAKGSFYPETAGTRQYDLQPLRLLNPMQISGLLLLPISHEKEVVLEGIENTKRRWETRPVKLVAATSARLDGKNEYLFTLERHYSSIDNEIGLRPYVYSVTRDGLIARWRGSALAWPLLDALILPDDETILCGLHRGDSFVDLQPHSKEVRVAAYRWNGFGFSGIDIPEIMKKCRRCFEITDEEQVMNR